MTASNVVGFRIYLNTPRPPAAETAALRGVPTGNVCDAMDRLGAMDFRIKPLDPTVHLHGPALTVRTRPGDNLMVWKALDVALPGDVLVIATYGHATSSTLGELVVKAARSKGIAGIVCDGMCRDASGIRAAGVPVFVAGCIPSSPGKDGPGEIGAAITCAGVVVQSGDVVVGDEDGVVVIPRGDLAAVIERLPSIAEKEARRHAEIDAGQPIPASIDQALADKGCEFIDLARTQ